MTTEDSQNPVASAVAEAVGWYLNAYPVSATVMGSGDPDHTTTLGDHSAEGFERRAREAAEQLAKLDALAGADGAAGAAGAVSESVGDFEDGIDRDLVRAQLRKHGIMAERQMWRRDPAESVSPTLYGLYLPLQQKTRPEARLVEESLAKLKQVPEALAACRRNLDPGVAPKLLVERALGQARTGRGFVTESLPAMVEDPALRAELAEAAEPAAVAFDELATFLADFAERCEGDWRLGEATYSRLLQEVEMLGYDTAELHRRGQAAYEGLNAEMRELAARIPGGSRDWRATMEALCEDTAPTEEAMLAEYRAETARARQFTADHDLVTFAQGEECLVQPGPEFLRAVLSVASYSRPPALTPSRTGVFNVPFTPAGSSPEAVLGRLKTNARVTMPTIAVHEAYPGHHWHLSWLAEQGRLVRSTFTTSYFMEGWGLYIETAMREQGYFADPRHELGHLDARIFRAARIVADTALHTGEMSIEEAEKFMASKATLTPETAKGEVNRYCAWPTQAASYLTGCLEIEAIRAEYLKQGKGTLKQFHDTIAGSGGLPLGLARRVALR
ncbi:DUF885 domain-containing protein [Catenulispora sp. NL8]|uniref:DUF885 domain-containing protein n=1 Tax=Catenulispora pinistramenti TaxID=2705254 RepID=A0ABS5KKB9_9ACTN|nr:DUF885 domain-containing protein [Catenulispora pinistramenti]MBS2546251.1 DUF885 domain-containing protein [Catenulispora pinistramenti]